MGKYLFQVLSAFIFWACVIWFGLPLLKDHAPEAYNHLQRFFSSNAKIEKAMTHIFTKTEQTSKAFMPSKAFSNILPVDREDNEFVSVIEGHKKVSALTVTEKQKLAKNDPFFALNQDPGYAWGIVMTNSFVYDTEMKRIGIFLGGTVISRKRLKATKNGYISECFYLKKREWESETIFLYENDLVIFDCTYEEADVEQRNLLIKYYRTLAQYEEKRAQAYKQALRRNPHFDAYKQSINDYNAFFRRAKDANAALSQSAGPARAKLIDELRNCRANEPSVISRFKETKKRYYAWKEEHIGNGEHVKIPKTSDIQELETALQTMRPSVQMIIPDR